jgi:hypothetical protein
MRQARNFFATFAARLLIAALVAVVVPVMLSACGPAFRFRPAGLLAAGDVEIGGGMGAGALLDGDGGFGGAELQAFVRWTPEKAPRLELSHRFWTYTLISMGWAPEFRIQPVKGPFDLTIDFGGIFGLCWTLECGQDIDEHPIAAAIGFDVGLSVGKRFGGEKAVALYFSPHYQMAWTVVDPNWPGRKLLHFPVGLDIPLGNKRISLRPEIVFTLQIRSAGFAPLKRIGGGIALALNGPSPKKARKLRKQRKAAEAATSRKMTPAPAETPPEQKAPAETPPEEKAPAETPPEEKAPEQKPPE